MFKLHSDYKPTGDQPQAIEYLSNGIKEGKKFQTLLGVTGSGKTLTMANIIEKVQKPTLVFTRFPSTKTLKSARSCCRTCTLIRFFQRKKWPEKRASFLKKST